MSFRLATIDDRAALVRDDAWFDLERLGTGAPADPMEALTDLEALHAADAALGDATPAGSFAEALDAGRVGPPVPAPSACFGIGLNYRSHVAESNMAVPTVPVVFTKFPGCLVGPRATVELVGPMCDYEVELVVAIGPGGRNIDAASAWDHVAGLTVGQDISDRALQFAANPPHFDLGKSRDTFGPLGPVLVSPDQVPDRDALALTCDVDGDVRQRGTTADLIFSVPELIAYLSAIMTLRPGDLIFTGTPDGVGIATGKLLTDGCTIDSSIEGIGELRNPCRQVA